MRYLSIGLIWLGGFCIGFGVAGLTIVPDGPTYATKLQDCAKTHNVYRCEMVAVPKTGEVK